MNKTQKSYQKQIAGRVKDLRKKRGLTQRELAEYLDLSQNRVSQLEAGQGSFSAEHLLLLAKKFNVTPDSFVSEKENPEAELQNTLSRLGAGHLRESEDVIPSETLNKIADAVREVLLVPASPRAVTALAPIIVKHANPLVLDRIRLKLNEDGIIQRYGWLLTNIRQAIHDETAQRLPSEWKRIYEKADFVIKNLLAFPWFSLAKERPHEDILDSIVTKKTLTEVRNNLSEISKKWNVITRLQPEDFTKALREARETD